MMTTREKTARCRLTAALSRVLPVRADAREKLKDLDLATRTLNAVCVPDVEDGAKSGGT